MNVDKKTQKVKQTADVGGKARITFPPTLAKNLDKLKLCFWVDWKNSIFLDEIDAIKKSLQDTTDLQEQPFQNPGGFLWNVQRTGTRMFNYRLTAGDLFLLINKRTCEGNVPNMMLEIGSESCWSPGFEEIFYNFTRWIEVLEGKIIKNQVSEVHLAADLLGTHIETLNIRDKRYWITKSHKFRSVESPRQIETFSIGQGDIMMRIYDKVLELRYSAAKQATFADSWGVEKYDEQPVTRLEFQLRREILKNIKNAETNKGIDSYEDLCDSLNAIWRYCTHSWVRHCLEPVDSDNNHQSRAEISDFWNFVSLIQWEGDTDRAKEKPRPKKDYIALRKQFLGLGMTLAAFHNIGTQDIDHIINIGKHIIEEDMLAFFVTDEEEFYRRIDKKKREVYETVSPAHRLKPDHPSSHFYPNPYPPFDHQGDFHV